MPNKCAIKKGFLVLRDCDAAASTTCPTCNRAMCAEHKVGHQCSECYGNAHRDEEWRDDQPGNVFSQRSRFYSSDRYSPLYLGGLYHHSTQHHHHDSIHDHAAVDEFDSDAGDTDFASDDSDFDDAAGADFFDS